MRRSNTLTDTEAIKSKAMGVRKDHVAIPVALEHMQEIRNRKILINEKKIESQIPEGVPPRTTAGSYYHCMRSI